MVGIVNISTILSVEIPSKHILLAGEWAYLLYQWSKPIVFWRRQKKILNYENERLYVQSKGNGIVHISFNWSYFLISNKRLHINVTLGSLFHDELLMIWDWVTLKGSFEVSLDCEIITFCMEIRHCFLLPFSLFIKLGIVKPLNWNKPSLTTCCRELSPGRVVTDCVRQWDLWVTVQLFLQQNLFC